MSKPSPVRPIVFALLVAFGLPAAVLADGPAPQNATKTVDLKIEGMVTNACPVLVKRAAGSIDGVRHVDASLEHRSAQIEYEPGKTSVEQIVAVIKDRTGLSARPLQGCKAAAPEACKSK